MIENIKTNNISIKPRQFLNWLMKRLEFKYKENSAIISTVEYILCNYTLIPKRISKTKLDNICKKYYSDFDMQECEINMGYNDRDREKIRSMILGIASELCGE